MDSSTYLRNNWKQLTWKFPPEAEHFFHQLIEAYTEPQRHYHNLVHIEALLRYVTLYESQLQHPEILQWAIWYHDVIYDVRRKDNERKSAELAEKHLASMGVDAKAIALIAHLIQATQHHQLSASEDSFDGRFFMDIDLSILAAEPNDYEIYTQQIRKEYRMYPDFLYKKGRKKVLSHFLKKNRIYLTDVFFEKWESQARANLHTEFEHL